MGAPGEALFCKKGHLYKWFEEHLYWDAALWKERTASMKAGCPCGAGYALSLAHYGNVGDCITDETAVIPVRKETFRVDKTFDVYDMEKIKKALQQQGYDDLTVVPDMDRSIDLLARNASPPMNDKGYVMTKDEARALISFIKRQSQTIKRLNDERERAGKKRMLVYPLRNTNAWYKLKELASF